MKSFIKVVALGAAMTLGAQSATAGDKEEILGSIEKFFIAMENKDTDTIRGIMLPESDTFAVRDGSDAPYRMSTLDQYANGLANAKARIQERIVDPDMKISGRLAYVWAFFQLYVDGDYNNCGMNLFNFIKTADGWRMASGTYSVIEEKNCSKHYSETAWQDGTYILYSGK